MPTLSGAVVALVSGGRSGLELLAIGGLGLSATTGVLAYELRNGELCRRAGARAARLETALFPDGPLLAGAREPRLLGVVPASHRLGIGLVYGAALAGWTYLVVWGALAAAGAHAHARSLGLVAGAVAGVAVVAEVVRLEGATGDEPAAATTPAPSR